ncbi:PIBF1 [Symbiodinium natans]|uniref:PIBF1 protein n=1 Tax=Symbiodinium natans TaxID=878477 RepID=A0A812S371_9DINO|nr:PIBF1 [Symbiodinium natans]
MRELPLDSLHDEALTKTVGVLVAVGRWAAEEHVPADLADNCPYLPTSTYEPTSGAFVGFTLAIASAQAIAVLVVLPMMWRQATQLTPIVVDADIDAFRRADAPAARAQLAYLDSLTFMRAVKNQSALGQRTMLKVEILYEAKDGSVFSESVQRDIRAFEQSLRSLPGWAAMCNMSEPALQFHCNPGDSMGNYVWPRRLDAFLNTQGYFRLAFDGSALERLPMDAVIAYLSEGLAAPHDLRMFLPMTFVQPSSGSKLLRSVFGFSAPDLNDTTFRAAFQDFVQNELYSALLQAVVDTRKPVDPASWDQPPAIQIYFRGDVLDEHELLEALYSDMLLAIGPLFISLAVAWVKLRSAVLAFVGTLFLCLAALIAYVLLPVEQVSPATFLGIFLLFGLGFSSIFRMQEVWRRSRNEAKEDARRLMYVHRAAVREMLPVVGSACCYFLLLNSKLLPLREFGVFIGTSMLLACAFALLCFVPFLLLHERTMRPWIRRRLPRKLVMVLEPAELKPVWEDVAAKIMLAVKRPKPVLAGAGFAVAVALIVAVAVTASQPYPALPKVFPPEHHREAGRPMLQSFAPSTLAEEEAPLTIQMCEPGRGLASCALHWCDLESTPSNNLTSWPTSQAATCRCYSRAASSASCTNISLSLVVSGSRPAFLTQEVLHAQALSFASAEYSDATWMEVASATSRRLQSVVLEDWPSGTTQVDALTQLPQINLGFTTARRSSSTCEDSIYCYCSPKSCTTPSGFRRTQNDLTLPAQP